MIHGGTPHRIFEISELTREIASQLALVSLGSTVNFACVCRYLEQPVLSILWETQSLLCTLLKTLPKDLWRWETLSFMSNLLTIVDDPPPGTWNRVQRYASWMHRIEVDEWTTLEEETFRKFRSNSPAGGWFPALQVLHLTITESNLPHADLFLSPHLTDIFISASSSWLNAGFPHNVLPAVAAAINTIPTSALQSLWIDDAMSQEGLEDPLSSVVLRCGPSLTKFDSVIPLSGAATNHLIQLPRLHDWHTIGPPLDFPSSLPLAFPPLMQLILRDRTACGWLSLLNRSEESAPTTQGLSGVRESLRSLIIGNLSDSVIDVSLVSKIQIFRNLISLTIQICCQYRQGPCGFKLNNDNVAKLAITLPQIETLVLGYMCGENTCATTVACFLPISACCVKLQYLEVHFNTTKIIDDLKDVLEDSRFQELSSLPRCALTCLGADFIPLSLDEAGLGTVARGLVDLFPSLERCLGDEFWGKISETIDKLRGI